MGDFIQPSSAEEKIAVLQRQLNQAVTRIGSLETKLVQLKDELRKKGILDHPKPRSSHQRC